MNFVLGNLRSSQTIVIKFQNIGMEDYLGRNLVGEIKSLKIIDEVNLFSDRPVT